MHFWVYDDGSYQEEGHNMVKGFVWEKAGIKIICSLFSLPFGRQSSYASGGLSALGDVKQEDIKKLLLIGCSGSGMSTIFEQAKFLYKDVPFMEDELENIKFSLRSNIYGYICILIESRQLLEDEELNELRRNQFFDEQRVTGYTDPGHLSHSP